MGARAPSPLFDRSLRAGSPRSREMQKLQRTELRSALACVKTIPQPPEWVQQKTRRQFTQVCEPIVPALCRGRNGCPSELPIDLPTSGDLS